MKYLSKRPFSSRPATPEFRRNWEETFQKSPGTPPAGTGSGSDAPGESNILLDLLAAIGPLAAIADAHEEGEFRESHPDWDKDTVLLTGRFGRKLLTLGDAIKAREAAEKLAKMIRGRNSIRGGG
jgi:hypothetical protein